MVNTCLHTESLYEYQKLNGLGTWGIYSKNGILGAIFCIVGGIAVFFNQFIVLRLRDKMFEKPAEEAERVTSETEEEKPAAELVDE